MNAADWDEYVNEPQEQTVTLADLAEQLALECRSSQEMTPEIQRLALAVLRQMDVSKRNTVEWGEWTTEDVLRQEG